jgi:hypothetical protein
MRALVLFVVCACDFHTPHLAGDAPTPDARSDAPIDVSAIDAPPVPMVTFVHSTSGSSSPWNTGVTSFGLPLSQDPVAGDVVAVYLTHDGRVTLNSFTDNMNDTYSIVQFIIDNSNQQKAVMAYARVAASGPLTITANFSSAGCCNTMIVHELHGANATTPLDTHAGQLQTGVATTTDAVTTGTATTHANNEYVFAATSDSSNAGGQKINPGTGETPREVQNPSMGNPSFSEDRVVAAPGSIASTFTFVKSGNALSLEMMFQP